MEQRGRFVLQSPHEPGLDDLDSPVRKIHLQSVFSVGQVYFHFLSRSSRDGRILEPLFRTCNHSGANGTGVDPRGSLLYFDSDSPWRLGRDGPKITR